MSKQTEALKLALEALEDISSNYMSLPKKGCMALAAIEEALAEQPAQQPVSWERFMSVEKELQDMTAEFMRVANELAAIKAQQQEPVLWQILNGVCHAGVRSTENLAKEAAAGMQKTHDLGGSLAAFHVRPLYASPPASKPWVGLTDEDLSVCDEDGVMLARYWERVLREKNNG